MVDVVLDPSRDSLHAVRVLAVDLYGMDTDATWPTGASIWLIIVLMTLIPLIGPRSWISPSPMTETETWCTGSSEPGLPGRVGIRVFMSRGDILANWFSRRGPRCPLLLDIRVALLGFGISEVLDLRAGFSHLVVKRRGSGCRLLSRQCLLLILEVSVLLGFAGNHGLKRSYLCLGLRVGRGGWGRLSSLQIGLVLGDSSA